MANHAMILEKHTAVRKGRIHDGKVMVMRSNLRWCCDGLEFTYFLVKAYGDTRMPSRHQRQVKRAVRDFVKLARAYKGARPRSTESPKSPDVSIGVGALTSIIS